MDDEIIKKLEKAQQMLLQSEVHFKKAIKEAYKCGFVDGYEASGSSYIFGGICDDDIAEGSWEESEIYKSIKRTGV